MPNPDMPNPDMPNSDAIRTQSCAPAPAAGPKQQDLVPKDLGSKDLGSKDLRAQDKAPAGSPAMTPMMAQYHEIKAANPGSLLFFRMGDFYELFFDDAVIAAQALGITLTRRGKHLGQDIPMSGVPVETVEDYLKRLIRQGHRVVLCEQTEDKAETRKRGHKAIVRREVRRHVTPGTLTEDTMLDARGNNFLASVSRVRGSAPRVPDPRGSDPKSADQPLALAWADISTGAITVMQTTDPETLAADIARLAPSEIILPESLHQDPAFADVWTSIEAALTPLASSRFDSQTAERRLKQTFKVAALDGFGDFSRAEIAACGALVDYIALTQVDRMPVLSPPSRERHGTAMMIDPATRTNLELVRTLSGERKGSLLSVIDRTVTGAGARKLSLRLAAPLTDPAAINRRLDAVGYFVDACDVRERMRTTLRRCPDIARALARITVGRGGPRDLAALRGGLAVARELPALMERTVPVLPPGDRGPGSQDPRARDPGPQDSGTRDSGTRASEDVAVALSALGAVDRNLERLLDAALDDDLPLLVRDGGFVRPGHDEALDENRRLRDESRKVIAGLQAGYVERTGIKSLKVRHNGVLGYFVEVPSQHGSTLMNPPHDTKFIHRQTIATAMRFTTAEMADLQSRISSAAGKATEIELEIFTRLVAAVEAASHGIATVADALAELDVASGLAEFAETARLTRPEVDDSMAFRIKAARHPVVEAALTATGEAGFVPNDCDLSVPQDNGSADSRSIWLLTGPNMAGKSTFLRQNALIAILAQMGSFVPAAKARIGVVDRLFSRVGAADDLARGRSTFMVEMVETATILNQASERSLVILDEIGRGTATYDGLSIAWACVEHLHEVNRCRALFATHFHELTALAGTLPRLANATMKVKEWDGEVIFLHEVAPGCADRSYGIHVARLAGLPPAVIDRATDVLAALERGERDSPKTDPVGRDSVPNGLIDALPLFAAVHPQGGPVPKNPARSAVEDALDEIRPDDLSPRAALELIYRLKDIHVADMKDTP